MKHIATIISLLALTACAGGPPLSLDTPQPASLNNELVSPPWEALVEAGPDAYKDIDYETLDGPGSNQPPNEEPANAIKSVALIGVKGARGSGNADLADALKARIELAGWPIVTTAESDSLKISGNVATTKDPNGERIEITWHAETPDGRVLGDIKQVNTVPKGSVNTGFGETADLIADGAATGIFDLVDKYR